jgi:hypothetical protein
MKTSRKSKAGHITERVRHQPAPKAAPQLQLFAAVIQPQNWRGDPEKRK